MVGGNAAANHSLCLAIDPADLVGMFSWYNTWDLEHTVTLGPCPLKAYNGSQATWLVPVALIKMPFINMQEPTH